MALGLGPWLAVEIPDLIAKGKLKYEGGGEGKSEAKSEAVALN
jgi:hypothetical protein